MFFGKYVLSLCALLCLAEFYVSLHNRRIHVKGCGRESLDRLVVLRVTTTINIELRERASTYSLMGL